MKIRVYITTTSGGDEGQHPPQKKQRRTDPLCSILPSTLLFSTKDKIPYGVKAEAQEKLVCTRTRCGRKRVLNMTEKHDLRTDLSSEVKSEQVGRDGQRRCGKRDRIPVTACFDVRLPLWKEQCIDFQKRGKCWAPLRPCCMPGIMLMPRGPPSGDLTPCYDRLSRERKAHFRRFIEKGLVLKQLGPGTPHFHLIKHLLFPEEHVKSLKPKRWEPLPAPNMSPWQRDLPARMSDGRALVHDANKGVSKIVEASKATVSNFSVSDAELRNMARTKTCRLRDVTFDRKKRRLRARWKENRKCHGRYFPIRKFKKQGLTEDPASIAARHAATRVPSVTRTAEVLSSVFVDALHCDEGEMRVLVEAEKCQVPGENRWRVVVRAKDAQDVEPPSEEVHVVRCDGGGRNVGRCPSRGRSTS